MPSDRRPKPRSLAINLGRAALLRLPIWSCTAESLPSHDMSPLVLVGSYIKPSRAPPFHPSPVLPTGSHRLVCSLLHLSSGHPAWPLASPLPFGVRTFLSPRLNFQAVPAAVRPAPSHQFTIAHRNSTNKVRNRSFPDQGTTAPVPDSMASILILKAEARKLQSSRKLIVRLELVGWDFAWVHHANVVISTQPFEGAGLDFKHDPVMFNCRGLVLKLYISVLEELDL